MSYLPADYNLWNKEWNIKWNMEWNMEYGTLHVGSFMVPFYRVLLSPPPPQCVNKNVLARTSSTGHRHETVTLHVAGTGWHCS